MQLCPAFSVSKVVSNVIKSRHPCGTVQSSINSMPLSYILTKQRRYLLAPPTLIGILEAKLVADCFAYEAPIICYSGRVELTNFVRKSSHKNFFFDNACLWGSMMRCFYECIYPDNKVHWAKMGPTWVLSAPDRPHVGPMNLAIRVLIMASSLLLLCRMQYHIMELLFIMYTFISWNDYVLLCTFDLSWWYCQ